MIAGQAAELALSGTPADASVLSSRELKTSGLMRLMMVAGAIISGASRTEINALATFGECLGQAYQIYDDLADNFSDHQQTGKSVGQDLRHLRPTVVLGLTDEEIQVLAARIIQTGKDALDQFGSRPEAELLRSAADQIVGGLNPAAARKIDGSLHSSEA
jgi:geranylgeranyl pyrophosphate synthase